MRPFIVLQLAALDLAERLRDVQRGAKERGASAVEYALLIALIAAVIITAVYFLGQLVSKSFENTCKSIAASAGAGLNGTSCS